MKTTWVFETNLWDETVELLSAEVTKQGMEFILCRYLPFQSGKYDSLLPENSCAVFYGSLNMAAQLRREVSWIPGVYCNLPAFKCTNYFNYLGEHLLNEDYIIVPFKDLDRKSNQIFSIFESDQVFIRPNDGFKSFTGMVAERQRWVQDYKEMSCQDPNLVIVSSAKNISMEWRLVVCQSEIIAWSQYRSNGKLIESNEVPDHVIAYGNKVCKKFNPDLAWTLDICESEGNLYILEVGSFSSAGLYACDPSTIVKKISAAAVFEHKDIFDV